MQKINGNWVDENNNSWPCDRYTEEEAVLKSKSLTRCSDCSDCSGCSLCSDCSGCSLCSGCSGCSRCSRCSDCVNCSRCSRCSGCSDCSDYKENPQRYVSKKIGSRDENTSIYWTTAEDVQVVCGCFRGDITQFTARVEATHPDGSEHLRRYLALIALIRTIISAEY